MQDQTDLLLNVLVIGLFAVLFAWMVSTALKQNAPKKKCSPHVWSIHPVTNKLTCTECGYVAGSDKTEES